MIKSQSINLPLCIVLLTALSGCRTYEYVTDIPSEQFDEDESLGSIEVRYERLQDSPPTLKSVFRRKVLESEMGFAGTYMFAVVYPTVKIDEDYSWKTLEGESLEEGQWRFKIPYKRGWNGPQDLQLHFRNDYESRDFLFRFLEGQSCLNEYSLETPGNPTLHVSVNLKESGCLLPCTAKLSDPATCSNFWR